MFEPELGRFFTQDRFSDKYSDFSPYQYGLNNPVRYIDINGDSAWQITRQWDKNQMASCRYSTERASQAKENGEDYTCEDFVLSVLIDFASQNGLPVSIENGEGTHDAYSDDFNSVEEYKSAVFKTTGARDLQKDSNTNNAAFVKAGDLILGRMDDNVAFHVQMVTSVKNDRVEIHQGAEGPGTSDANSFFYAGKNVSKGVWNTSTDVYTNPPKTIGEYSKNYNIEGRKWNFGNFNKRAFRK